MKYRQSSTLETQTILDEFTAGFGLFVDIDFDENDKNIFKYNVHRGSHPIQ